MKVLVVLSPSNPGIFFELGLLEYNQRDYVDAVAALNQAITLSPVYANAEYFLGLSDYYLNDTIDAIAEFETLAKSTPDIFHYRFRFSQISKLAKPRSPASTSKSSTLPVTQ